MKIKMKSGGRFRTALSRHLVEYEPGAELTFAPMEIAHLDKADYTVVGEDSPVVEDDSTIVEEVSPNEPDAPDLSGLKKDELIALAGEKGIELPGNATKAEIIALLSQ